MDSLFSVDQYRPTSGSDRTNASKTDQDQAEATVTMQESLPVLSETQWLDDRMEDMELIADEEFKCDDLSLQEFLNESLSPSPPANGSSSNSSFTSSFSADFSMSESHASLNDKVNGEENIGSDVEGVKGEDAGDSVGDVNRSLQTEKVVYSTKDFQSQDVLLKKYLSTDSTEAVTGLENSTQFESQPMNNTQPKEMKFTKATVSDEPKDVLSSWIDHTSTKSQLTELGQVPFEETDSKRIDLNVRSFSSASSTDTYVVSRSSSPSTVASPPTIDGKTNTEDVITSMTLVVSEASSVDSFVFTENRELCGKVGLIGKGLRVPSAIGDKGRMGISNLKTKLTKPSSKISLLPSKPLDKKASKKVPLTTALSTSYTSGAKAKDNLIRKSLIPTEIHKINSRLSFSKSSQPNERKAGSMKQPHTTDAGKTLTFRRQQPPHSGRVRKTSIPRSSSFSNLHKKTLKTSTTEVHPCGEVISTFVKSKPTVASKPSPVSNDVIQSNKTPERNNLTTTTTPSRTKTLDKPSKIKPSSLSMEGRLPDVSVPDSTPKSTAFDGSVAKTPRTVTKRRSFIPTPGRIDKKDLAPFNLQGCEKRNAAVDHQIVSAANPDQENRSRSAPASKQRNIKSQNPAGKKPKSTFCISSRPAFKPRNGQVSRIKSSVPLKAKAPIPREDREVIKDLSKPKVVHSPVNKENIPETPHSKWSPIHKKQNISEEESHHQCTKRTHHV